LCSTSVERIVPKHSKPNETKNYENTALLTANVELVRLLARRRENENQKAAKIKSFSTADPTISKDVVVTKDKAWLADCKKAQVIRLFEVSNPDVEQCVVTYRVKLKTEGLKEPAYLEMWCRFPGKGEFFSRDLEHPITGSNDWASYETPFFLKKARSRSHQIERRTQRRGKSLGQGRRIAQKPAAFRAVSPFENHRSRRKEALISFFLESDPYLVSTTEFSFACSRASAS